MYDPKRRTFRFGVKVKDLIDELSKFPQEADVLICGDSYCYIHVETDNSTICLDNESLDECYDDRDA